MFTNLKFKFVFEVKLNSSVVIALGSIFKANWFSYFLLWR